MFALKSERELRVSFLGTGSAEGVPVLGCSCENCKAAADQGGRNVRLRPSLLVSWGEHSILVDAGPDVQCQLVRSGVTSLTAVLLTHWHYDHFGGIGNFMYWDRHAPERREIPLLLNRDTLSAYENYCAHMFRGQKGIPEKYRPRLLPQVVKMGDVVRFGDVSMTFYDLDHGEVPTTSAVFDRKGHRVVVLYDTGPKLLNGVEELVHGARIGITEAAYPDDMPASKKHLRTSEAIELGSDLGWDHTYLTHISHFSAPHDVLSLAVREDSRGQASVAYDGLTASSEDM